MAGGKSAAEIARMTCYGDEGVVTRARRVYEGEADRYRREKGHQFAMDWPEPATEPQWPSPDLVEEPVPAQARRPPGAPRSDRGSDRGSGREVRVG